MYKYMMVILVSLSLIVPSYAQAGIFKKMMVVGGLVVVGKAIAKHKQQKLQQPQQQTQPMQPVPKQTKQTNTVDNPF